MLLTPIQRPWAAVLNLIGIVLVAVDLAQRSLDGAPVAVAIAAWAAWAAWLVVIFVPERRGRLRAALYLGMVAGGSLAAITTDVVGFVPAAVALIVLAGTPAFPLRLVGVAAAGSLILIAADALISTPHRGSLTGVLSLVAVTGIGGLSRRQYRISEAQSLALLEERLAVEQERAEVAALTERSRIARDLHDVLAHSLGGLVIQLEAVDALLESNRTGEARDRVQAARKLAVSGLDEARRAVTALREPDEPLSTIVAALATTHRTLGGQVAVRGNADRGTLTAAGRTAARRAVQELLTNARRHAPGAPTTLDLDWDDDILTITASTPGGAREQERISPGGGHGLAGMRERVSEAGGSMDVREGAAFDVVLRLPGKMSS
ncbi:sensor histidine kinase [Paractinoplanes toevensis]|uniref:histidine kinase n=1 Tax=Paractinoplanes toevensis TaxID=571911 RepID=A0A919W3X9_9ACTN|nr:histidine kinase [Actinoplanes toevensis]GIM90995.1 two-component sensor histidine kinase [Actinoplanes toevensis]